MQPRTRVLAGAFPADRQRMAEMYGLLCGTSMKPGIVHTLDRTVGAVDKLERTVGDFMQTTSVAITGLTTSVKQVLDITQRHEARLNENEKTRNNIVAFVARIFFEKAVGGMIQAAAFIVGIVLLLARMHIPALPH